VQLGLMIKTLLLDSSETISIINKNRGRGFIPNNISYETYYKRKHDIK
jgi:hypothetical protein